MSILGKLRNPQGYLASKWDWSFLVDAECFGGSRTRISPSDVDGSVHIRSIHKADSILHIETKNPGEALPRGQKMMLEGYVRLGQGYIDAIVVWGNSGTQKVTKLHVSEYIPETNTVVWHPIPNATKETLITICKNFYTKAKERKPKMPETGQFKNELTVITPAYAKELLANNFKNNRTIKKAKLDSYARDMGAGKWRVTGDAIKLSNGMMVDGQHRLWACIKADRSFETYLFQSSDENFLQVLDTGIKRSPGDLLRILGYDNSNAIAAVASYLFKYRMEQLWSHNVSVSPEEILSTVKPNAKSLQYSIKTIGKNTKRLYGAVSIPGFLHFVFYERDAELANEFFNKLETGMYMGTDHPVYTLRVRLEQNAMDRLTKKGPAHRLDVLHWTIKAWNYFIQGKPLKVLRIAAKEARPTIG